MTIDKLSRAVALFLKRASWSGSIVFHGTLATSEILAPSPIPPSTPGRKKLVEKLWEEFFEDASQWSDHRLDKENALYPDFKHKKTQKGLWLDSKSNPPWVEKEIAEIQPETLQASTFSWNQKISKYVEARKFKGALETFEEMQQMGVTPNRFTFVPVLRACASLRALEQGRSIHELIVKTGCKSDAFVDCSLIDMYAKCGSIVDAQKVFNRMRNRNVVSWSALITGYVKCGEGRKALDLFQEMKEEGVEPDHGIYVGLLNACASLGQLAGGRLVHEEIVNKGYESNESICSSLINMYAKCGSIENARTVFNEMHKRTVVYWSAMIIGYVKCGDGQRALDLYWFMQQEKVDPNPLTFVGVLNACASVGALGEGRLVHEQIVRSGCKSDIYVASSLVNMYAKCGSMEDAEKVFERMPRRNVVSCNALLGGYALLGQAHEALQLFQWMHQEGVKMDEVTFVTLLSACSHGGLVDEGLHFLNSMGVVHRIPPTAKHYTCIIDLLGRAGRFHEAEDLIKSDSCGPVSTLWMSLVSACRIHDNIEMGENAGKQVVDIDSENFVDVLSANMYPAVSRKVNRKGKGMTAVQNSATKQSGFSWIEVDNEVHSFTSQSGWHPDMVAIRAELKRLSEKMVEQGYVPDNKSVLHGVDEGTTARGDPVCNHSEKVAIAFGLISTPAGTPLRIVKISGVCQNCHSAMKFIANMVGREILVRDSSRFHHFQDGFCSCKDYW